MFNMENLEIKLRLIFLCQSILLKDEEYLRKEAREKLSAYAKHYNIRMPQRFEKVVLTLEILNNFCDVGKPKQETILNLWKAL